MKPKEFKGQNVVFAENQEEYGNLPAFRNQSKEGEVVTFWELEEGDLEMIKEQGGVWLMQMTFNQALQPVLMSAHPLIEFPNEESKEEEE